MTTVTGTHMCPGPGCRDTVTREQLACPRHWQQVPDVFQRAVLTAWDRGLGEGSLAHEAACRAAVTRMRPVRAPRAQTVDERTELGACGHTGPWAVTGHLCGPGKRHAQMVECRSPAGEGVCGRRYLVGRF